MQGDEVDLETSKQRGGGVAKRPASESRLRRDGLPVGSTAPDFTLPQIDGTRVDLGEFRGQHVLLVFVDPHCGPCDALMPALFEFHASSREKVQLVVVSRGEVSENARKADAIGGRFPFVIQKGWSLSKRYGIFATPVAFLVDPNGLTAREVVVGADSIQDVMEELRHGSESPLVRLLRTT